MKILAVDPGVTQAGFAIFDPDHKDREKAIECLSFTATGATQEQKAEQFGRHLDWMIRHFGIDFICFEQAVRQIFQYERKADWAGERGGGPSADQLVLAEVQGHIRQAAISHVLPFDSVAVKTWRAAILGRGWGNAPREQAKAQAKLTCDRLEISYRNHNEAEAGCIACWCATCSQVYRAKLYGLAI